MSLGDRYDHTQAVPASLAGLTTPEGVRDKARRYAATQAADLDDCRLLLDMLGLGPTEREIADRRTS